MRMCAGCRGRKEKAELARLALGSQGKVTLDTSRNLPGRGAYLCMETWDQCLAMARRRRGISRSLRAGDDAIDYADLAHSVESSEIRPSQPPKK